MTAAQEPIVRDERQLLRDLRQGDEQAFAALLHQYHGSLVHFARTFVRDREVAEEVVQETWLGVIRGRDRFRGDCSLKTWIFRIMINTARTRAVQERRSVPFSALGDDASGTAVDAGRFLADGHWSSVPTDWSSIPEERLLAGEALSRIQEAVETLPPMHRQVIVLRDVGGWTSGEVCALLDLSEANQRVLLHRARSKVRAALEDYLEAA